MPKDRTPTGKIYGPDPEQVALGDVVKFTVTDIANFGPHYEPYVYAEAFQDGELVYGQLLDATSGSVEFFKFGYQSMWSDKGGPANCEAWLVAYGGFKWGGTRYWIDSVSFHAEG